MKISVNQPTVNRATVFAALLAMLLFILATWLAVKYVNSPIIDFHSFRQTQTALTSYWTCRAGFRLAYWTPVGGFPWSIPMEFPIYQWIVSSIACPLGLNLDPVGRGISYLFWIACLWPAWIICRRLFGPSARLYFWIFTTLFLSSPLYLFDGRLFLIETAALFLALMYLAFSLEMSFGRDRWADAILTGAFLILALLQKSTTVAPLLLFGLVYLCESRKDLWRTWVRSEMLWKGIVAYVVPFAIGMAWIRYSDHVKLANALGRFLTADALRTWNYGTLAHRFSRALWHDAIWDNAIATNTGYLLGLCVILAGFLFVPRRRFLIACSVGLFLLFFMVFENLLYVHMYYLVENTIFLIFALAVAIGGLIESRPKSTSFALLALAGVIAINLHSFFSGPLFAAEKRHYDDTFPTLAVAKFVREHTPPDSPILVYGDDWSSEIPYYSQRRAFAAGWIFSPYLAPLEEPEHYLDSRPGAILVCKGDREKPDVIARIAERYSAWPKTAFSMCDVYLRRDDLTTKKVETQAGSPYNPAR